MRTRAKNNITKPNQNFSLHTTTTKLKIPKIVAEALRDPNWRGAMLEEINAQIQNGTHEHVPPHLSKTWLVVSGFSH